MVATRIETGETSRSSRRCLFGRPEPGQIDRELTERTDRMMREDCLRYNFDFTGGVPTIGGDGDYEFVGVSAANIPEFYHDRVLRSPRRAPRRRNSTPVSDTVAMPDEIRDQLLLIDDPEPTLFVASTSNQLENYEKPVTRSSVKKTATQQDDTLKQTKLTNYMPVRKRRSETNLLAAVSSPSVTRSISTSEISQKDKRSTGANKNKSAPKRPLRFAPPNIPKSSVSDTALVSSPRSPPAKKMPTATRRAPRRSVGAGDF